MTIPRIQPFLLTCPARAAILAETLASWRATDWGADPVVICDALNDPNPQMSQTCNSLRLLQVAEAYEWDYLLFLEDDLTFNFHLRHNLHNWNPIRYEYARLSTLYTTAVMGVGMLSIDYRTCIVAAQNIGGSQALVIHRSVFGNILSCWSLFRTEMQDLRIARSIALVSALAYVHQPSLVQHRSVPSTWNGPRHSASNFDREFLANRTPGFVLNKANDYLSWLP